MQKKTFAGLILAEAILFFGGFSLWSLLKPDADSSDTERRKLTQAPAWDTAAVLSGDYASRLEAYQLDQFPLRDTFRTIHALHTKYLLGKRDNGGVYLCEGHLSKLSGALDEASVRHASERIRNICDRYLQGTDTHVYLSVIPDKNYFLAEPNGYPSLDYAELLAQIRAQNDELTYLDLLDTLELSDYYQTDTHWRQECLIDVAKTLTDGMGIAWDGTGYTKKRLEHRFHGVYAGQSALPLPGEELFYLDSPALEACKVYDYENNREIPVYALEKGSGRDPYELFLSGSLPLITIENPQAATDRELILFRDSFGSSLAPLLAESYAKITLVDLRLISGNLLGKFIDFSDQDVLFLYSTLVWNDSVTMK